MADQTAPTSSDINAAKAACQQAEAELLALAERIWVDGRSATDGLMDIAEEFGAHEAMIRNLGAPEQFSALLARISDSVFADVADTLEAFMERVLEARDRLDTAIARREAGLRAADPARPAVVAIGGREFVIDANRGELRSVDDPAERYRLADEALAKDQPAAKPTLTEQLAKDAGIAPAKPAPPRDKTRGR